MHIHFIHLNKIIPLSILMRVVHGVVIIAHRGERFVTLDNAKQICEQRKIYPTEKKLKPPLTSSPLFESLNGACLTKRCVCVCVFKWCTSSCTMGLRAGSHNCYNLCAKMSRNGPPADLLSLIVRR